MYPYKVQILQAQTESNKQQRFKFCNQTSQRIENDVTRLENIFSDEAHFHLNCHVNKQNMRRWCPGVCHHSQYAEMSGYKTQLFSASFSPSL